MSVNIFAIFASIILMIIEKTSQDAVASGSPQIPVPLPICNVNLLKSLRLTGHEENSVPQQSTICNIAAADNCCSQIDEIKIIKSWNSYSLPKLKKFASDMSQIYNDFVNIEPYLTRLNASNIEYHFDNIAWRKTNESQCFSGKFFLEQSNYDLVKNTLNFTEKVVADFAQKWAFNFTTTTGKNVILLNETRRLVTEFLNNNKIFRDDMFYGFESFANREWAINFAKNFSAILYAQPQNVTKFPTVPDGKTPSEYYDSIFMISNITDFVLRNVSGTFFLQFLQSRVSEIHITSLINYLTTTLLNSLNNNQRIKMRNLNMTDLINDIADELFADEALKRYFSWFFTPVSRQRYIRVYKYLENRFYKIFSDTLVRSTTLSKHAHYAVLKEVMAGVSDASLRSVLWNSYGRIGYAMVVHLGFENYTQAIWNPSNTRKNTTFYLTAIKKVYRNPQSMDPNRIRVPDWFSDSDVRNNFANLANDVNKDSGNSYQINTNQPNYNSRQAIDKFNQLNLQKARYAEFSGDNKRVCATVYRHNLVREAIFNEKKFSYCLKINEAYKNTSAAARLGPLTDIKDQIQKLLDLKSTFLCSACSSKESLMIDVGSNQVQLDSKFCFAFVNEFRQYLNWRYTIFHDYQYQIFQYLSCFGRNANLTDEYPYPSFDNLLPENFTDWDACNSVTSIKNVSICFSICSKISLTSYSAWIEGDRVNLKRLYNYAITVMRQYGIQFGKYDPDREPPIPFNPPAGRLLEERKRAVFYDFTPEPRKIDRILQTQNTSNSSNASKESSPLDGFNEELLENPTLKLLYNLYFKINETEEYTRAEHYNHDEILAVKTNYKIEPPVSALVNMTTIVTGIGCNPFDRIKFMNLQEFMLKKFYQQSSTSLSEPLNRHVIKDCVIISKKDVDWFNDDYKMEISSKFKPVEKKIDIIHQNQELFERYRHSVSMNWIIMQAQNKTNSTSKKKPTRKLRNRQNKVIKTTGKNSFVSNLLFKILF